MNVYEVYDEYNNLLCEDYLHLPADESELSQRIVRSFDINSSNTKVKVYLEKAGN